MEDELLLEEPADEYGETDPEYGSDGEAMEQKEQPLIIEMIAARGIDLATIENSPLSSDKLAQIGQTCLEMYRRDKEERKDWEDAFDRIMAMVKTERSQKSFPWADASNVKYPLIMRAALKFGARAYPAIVSGTNVVKSASVGKDPDGQKRKRGDRIVAHMNYQLLLDMPEWDIETDRLCHTLPLQGTMFRQVIWDAEYSRPLTTLLSGKALVVTQGAKNLETVPHFAKEFPLFIHQIKEKQVSGEYRDVDLGMDEPEQAEKAGEQDMLECHCRYDLDGDGYAEPYIVVMHKQSEQLLSMKAGFWPDGVTRGNPDQDNPYGRVLRVRRHVEFIKYEFLPDPEGKFYGIGFGQLLLEHSEVINTILNQLIDAATDQNAGGGFVGRSYNAAGGNIEFTRGEWKFVNMDADDLRKVFIPRPTAQPSPAMFNLLQLMIEASRDLSSDQDIMDGTAPANTPATTVLAMLEEGMKVFSSIYKRMYRSLTQELRLIAKLNGAYVEAGDYQDVLDEDQEPDPMTGMPPPPPDPKSDYAIQNHDVVPVADPSMTTSAQKLARAQFLMQVGSGNPMLDQKEILRRVLEAASIDDIESLMPKPDPNAQAMQQEQMKVQLRAAMAEIMQNEASASDDMMAARLKFIEGNVKAQEATINAAAMKMSLMNMMGIFNGGPQANGPGMGGMGGLPPAPYGPANVQGMGGPQPPNPGQMGGAPMGAGQPGPVQPGPFGRPQPVEDTPPPVEARGGGY